MEQNSGSDKNLLSIIINIVLLVAVGILFFLHFSNKPQDEPKEQLPAVGPEEMKSKIAFVNSEEILADYALVEKLAKQLEAEQIKMDKDFTRKQKELEEDAAVFQESVQKQAISEQSAQKIYQQLMAKQEDLYMLQDQYQTELAEQEYRINQVILDSVKNFLDRFNAKVKFDYILNYNSTGSILHADDHFDITKQVVEGLNIEYFEKYPPKE